jgi:tetratricopeptide (TPR) repeat protein
MSSGEVEKEDPIKIHKEGTTLADVGKFEEASDKYLRASELYEKDKNFFDASYTLFKAAECNFQMKDYDKAKERFLKSADCYKALDEENQTEKLKQKIKEVKTKLQNF